MSFPFTFLGSKKPNFRTKSVISSDSHTINVPSVGLLLSECAEAIIIYCDSNLLNYTTSFKSQYDCIRMC